VLQSGHDLDIETGGRKGAIYASCRLTDLKNYFNSDTEKYFEKIFVHDTTH